MKRYSAAAILPALFFLTAVPAAGQTTSMPAPRAQGGCPLAQRTVIGAPYSGENETIHTQTLPDGTHIERKNRTTQFYRDSQGRLREEFYFDHGPLGTQERTLDSVRITDPVECAQYNLEVAKQIARRRTLLPNGVPSAGTPPQSKPAQSSAQHTTSEESRPKISIEELGTDTMEGLAVEGRRTTTTFPVGSVGNDRAFVQTSEIWTSQNLKVTILTKMSDPRYGETITRLSNIQFAVPPEELFRVPADYQIRDQQE